MMISGLRVRARSPDEAWGFEPEYETKEEIEALNREAAEGLVTESFEEDEEEGPRQTRHPDDRYIQVPHPNPQLSAGLDAQPCRVSPFAAGV